MRDALSWDLVVLFYKKTMTLFKFLKFHGTVIHPKVSFSTEPNTLITHLLPFHFFSPLMDLINALLSITIFHYNRQGSREQREMKLLNGFSTLFLEANI